jgi:tetratricopeptide (TPR) repeat protein
MATTKTTYHSKLYRDYRSIDGQAYHSQIRFFEQHESEILGLEENEFFDLLTSYSKALFLVGAYRKYLLLAEEVIAQTMERNVQLHQGEDLFLSTLFRKSYAHFRLLEYDKADYVLRHLLRIDPDHQAGRSLLRRTLYRTKPAYVLSGRAISVLCFLLAALVSALHLVFIRHFYPQWGELAEGVRNAFFLGGVGILVGVDVWHRWKDRQELREFLAEARQSRKKSK